MLRAKLLRFARRMKGIREQQKASGQLGLLGTEHGGLAPAAGLSAQENSRGELVKRGHCVVESLAIMRGISGPRWAEGAALAEGQVTAQHEVSSVGKCLRESHQQRSAAVSSGAMRQDEPSAVGSCWVMEKSANRDSAGSIRERLAARLSGRQLHQLRPKASSSDSKMRTVRISCDNFAQQRNVSGSSWAARRASSDFQ